MSDAFACAHSEESRAEAEGWYRLVFPKAKTVPSVQDHAIPDLEDLLGILGAKGFAVSVVQDQWCGVSVFPWNDPESDRGAFIQFDYGMLVFALCAAVLIVEDRWPDA